MEREQAKLGTAVVLAAVIIGLCILWSAPSGGRYQLVTGNGGAAVLDTKTGRVCLVAKKDCWDFGDSEQADQ